MLGPDTAEDSNVSLQSVPADVLKVIDRLFRSGFAVYVVGGALRDLRLGLAPKDWDLATDALPEQVAAIFPRIVPIGIRHGTVMVLTKQREIEVTTFSGSKGILGDLGRRDFTMNALALSYPEEILLDPHDGQIDLRKQTLRAVGDARSRFAEDPLRTLRAARFVSTYGLHVEPGTLDAIACMAESIGTTAAERVREEIFKLLSGENLLEAFDLMQGSGLLRKILPELAFLGSPPPPCRDGNSTYSHTATVIRCCPPSSRIRTAALLHSIPGSAPTVLNRWKASARLTREIVALTADQIPSAAGSWTDAQLRRYIARIGLDLLPDALDLASAHERSLGFDPTEPGGTQELRMRISRQIEQRVPFDIKNLAIDGHDVVKILAIKPGSLVGDILRRLHQKVLDDPALNRKEILVEFLRKEYLK
ncbi:MAG: hypothetical protein ABFD98_16135 [Syntrophobacteraceae bacterium]|nr:hypothetical protein [Desulfobacteraceae bacterium]